MKILLVGIGGLIGSILRYLTGILVNTIFAVAFPIATLSVNFVGSLLIGIISAVFVKTNNTNANLYLLITTGLLGGFTSFSAFSFETINLFENGKIYLGCLYVALSVILCLAGVMLGKTIIRAF